MKKLFFLATLFYLKISIGVACSVEISTLQVTNKMNIGGVFETAPYPLYISGNSGLGVRVDSPIFSTSYGNGRLGLFGYAAWSTPAISLPGDLITLANFGYRESDGTKNEFGEMSSVLVDPDIGEQTARVVFGIRGAGNTLLSPNGGSVFSVDPSSSVGSVIRVGKPESITSTYPFAGGFYAFGVERPDLKVSGITGNAQPLFPTLTEEFIARTTHTVIMYLGDQNGDFNVMVDSHVAGDQRFHPTSRMRITGGGRVEIGTSNSIVVRANDGAVELKGTTTNDNACEECISRREEIHVTTPANFPSSGSYDDAGSVTLKPGDWSIDVVMVARRENATWTNAECGVSSNSGNNGSGLTLATNRGLEQWQSASIIRDFITISFSKYRVQPTTETTYYLKVMAGYTSGQPQYQASMVAIRER